jgi:hypothetical protein
MDFVPSEKHCRNCNEVMPLKAKYCHNCGQKYSTGKVSIWQFIVDLSDAIFDIDSKTIRSVKGLFVPGRLTTEYFKGRHVDFVKPLRLFIFWGIVAFAILAYRSDDIFKLPSQQQSIDAAYTMRYNAHLDSVGMELRKEMRLNRSNERLLDSILTRMQSSKLDTIDFGYFKFDQGKIDLVQLRIPQANIYLDEPDKVLNDLQLKDFSSRFQVKQIIRMTRDPDNFIQFLIGKLTWMVLLILVLFAVVLKIIYIRQKRYYVEHLVFSLHCHTFLLLMSALGLLTYVNEKQDWILNLIQIAIIVYFFLAMKKYYGQGWGKTLLKLFLLFFSYVFVASIALILTFLVSALLF